MPGREAADDNARDDHGRRRRAEGGQQDRDRLDQERDAERRPKSRAVGEMSCQQRADRGADAVEHPIMRSRRYPLAKPPCDEVDQEDHVRHQRQSIEAVLRAQHSDDGQARPCDGTWPSGACSVTGASVGHAFQLTRVRNAGQKPQTVPALLETLLQQQRNEGAGCGDAEADTGKDHAADEASLARRRHAARSSMRREP